MTRFSVVAAIAALVVGCNGPGDDTSADSGDTCENSIVETFPESGASDVYYRTTVEVELDDAEDGATLVVSSASGDVAGTTEWAGDRMIFTPNEPLEPSTDYTVAVTYSCGDPIVEFTTSDVGTPIADPSTLIGNTYSLDLASGRFLKPEGVGPLLKEYVTTEVLVGITAVDSGAGTIQMIGAIAAEGSSPPTQSPCDQTIPFPEAAFENPYFAVGPEKTNLTIQGITVEIQDLFISGAFAPDAQSIQGAVLEGIIDTRPLVPLLDPEGEDDAICQLAVSIGVTCETCPGGGDFCLGLSVDSIDAQLIADLTLEEIIDPCLKDECSGEDECVQPAE